MSVMTSRETSTGGPDRDEQVGLDAWALCAEFVEGMLSDALAAAASADPGRSVPDVDWDRIWRAAEGATSDEAAIGRVVRAASEVARALALGTTEALPPTDDRVLPEVRGEADLTLPPPVVSAPDLPVEATTAETEPVTGQAETLAGRRPVTAQLEPVAAVEEPVTAQLEPVAAVEEPVTAPVILATSAVGSVTLDRPDLGAVTVAEPAAAGQLLTAPTGLSEPEQAAVAVMPAGSTHSGWFSAFTWVRNIGAIVILFVVWQLWGTAIAQHQAQDQLKAEFEAALRAHHLPKATAVGAVPDSGHDQGSAVGGRISGSRAADSGHRRGSIRRRRDELDQLVEGPGPLRRNGCTGSGGQRGHRRPPHDAWGAVQSSWSAAAWGPHHLDLHVRPALDVRGVRVTPGSFPQRRRGAQLLRGQPDHAHHLHAGVLGGAAAHCCRGAQTKPSPSPCILRSRSPTTSSIRAPPAGRGRCSRRWASWSASWCSSGCPTGDSSSGSGGSASGSFSYRCGLPASTCCSTP